MSTMEIKIERFSILSAKSFEETLAALDKGIGRPNMSHLHQQMAAAPTFSEFQRVINEAVGDADLMEFLRLDLGSAMRKDPQAKAYKIVRIITGNPLIMKQMVEHVPDAGSYAPITILVYERPDGVHLSYDKMASFLAPYKNAKASEVAESLDTKVIKLLTQAAA